MRVYTGGMKSKLVHNPSFRARDRDCVRIVGSLRTLLHAGSSEAGAHMVDVEAWVEEWIQLPPLELYGESPALALRHRGRWARIGRVLERMAGGVCA